MEIPISFRDSSQSKSMDRRYRKNKKIQEQRVREKSVEKFELAEHKLFRKFDCIEIDLFDIASKQSELVDK